MAVKNNVEVAIGGRVFTMSGYESEEYLQKLAGYINNKLNEYNSNPEYRRMSQDLKANLIYLNIADDYFKAKRIGDDLQNEIDEKDKEVYELKHELITDQIQLDTRLKELKDLKAELLRLQKENVRLETELESMMKNN